MTLRINYRLGEKQQVEQPLPDFEKANPDIKLVPEGIAFSAAEEYYAKIASMMAAGNLADVVFVSAGAGP